MTACAVIAMALTSSLFFFRAKGVFKGNKLAITFFALLWLCTLGSLGASDAVTAIELGNTGVCLGTDVKSFLSAICVVVGVHDTVVYFAIGLALTVSSMEITKACDREMSLTGLERKKFWLKSFFGGHGMDRIAKALLMSGQRYYL